MQRLCRFLDNERAEWGADVYPAPERVFEAFRLTPFQAVKVVILGQDPYPGQGLATGLAFSIPLGMRLTPSLRSVDAELQRTHGRGLKHGNLTCWAEQGVLLLNAVLTVFGPGGPQSHRGRAWEDFTDSAIRLLAAENARRLVFLVWGDRAKQTVRRLGLSDGHHRVLLGPHPGSRRGDFVGCCHFMETDRFLAPQKINWWR